MYVSNCAVRDHLRWLACIYLLLSGCSDCSLPKNYQQIRRNRDSNPTRMIGLPVINNTSDCRTFSNQVDLPKPNTSATEVIITTEADVIEPENNSNNHGSRPGITSKITEGTQTDSRGSDSANGLPDCFPEHSKGSKSSNRAWKVYLQRYNSDPCQDGQVPACKNGSVDGHLSPYTIAPQRP